MKHGTRILAIAFSLSALALAGCANNGNPLTTASLADSKVAQKAAFDPACVSLTAKIDGLRKEGTMARLAKVSKGKSSTTRVKRTALAKAAELDLANAQFQAKCSTVKPAMSASAGTSTTGSVVKTAAVTAATTAAKKKATRTATTAAVKATAKIIQ